MSPKFSLGKKESQLKTSQKHMSQIHIRKGTIIPKHNKHKVTESLSVKNIRNLKI